MTKAHFKESNLFENTIKFPRNRFSWGYHRGNRIENI